MVPAFLKCLQGICRLISSAPRQHPIEGPFLFKHRLNVDQVPLPFVVGDYDHTIDDKNGMLIPWLKEHIPNDEAVIFADNLDGQIQAAYLENQKEKGNAIGWSLLKGGTHWSQPVDQVLAETPLQTHVPAVTHVEMQQSVQHQELSEEEVESEDEDDSDEAEKWFVPEGFATVDTPVEAVDSSFVGVHIMFKWNGLWSWGHSIGRRMVLA
ncbi:hypothetical protein CYMTET_11249 [Cymbomonas tetramitiformis]|uniref:Uncharacterized protein n=1 Tax=Cymbomonas tetramitiformis TaxID=36881 RepID=A0AAE0GMY1_9CHLO|nr:hypothetical protein CYMTET_11249 [Cymbomonas tetramitiformis]